ncbi:MAG: hypothetical protein QXG62_02990, partial [Saccharolobus sp.]
GKPSLFRAEMESVKSLIKSLIARKGGSDHTDCRLSPDIHFYLFIPRDKRNQLIKKGFALEPSLLKKEDTRNRSRKVRLLIFLSENVNVDISRVV